MLHARQIMDTMVPRVRSDEPWADCARTLGPRHHLVVVDEQRRFLGLLTRGMLRRFQDGAAGDRARPAGTVRVDTPAAEALQVLLASGETAVAVLDDDGEVVGLICVEDAVQVARFVLPPGMTVEQVVRGLHRSLDEAESGAWGRWNERPRRLQVGKLRLTDQASRGADALADAEGPVPVHDGNGAPVGWFRAEDVVDALARWLSGRATT